MKAGTIRFIVNKNLFNLPGMITSSPANKLVIATLATSSADKTVFRAIPVNLLFAS